MKAFKFYTASSEESAVKLLGANSVAYAGGTNLLNLMKNYVLSPEAVVDLNGLEGSDAIEADGDGLKIGAGARLIDILTHKTVAKDYPALASALESVGTPQIRNSATLGGNLCCHTPCWYYNSMALRDQGLDLSKTPAREGENQYHAIFGNDGACVNVHASSAAPALIALDARVRVAGEGGAREMPLEDFFVIPETAYGRENVLKENEIVTHVILGPGNARSATYEVRHKQSHDWPVSLASVALEMSGATCKSARICLGAVAPIPWRSEAAEKALAGGKIDAAAASKAADAAVADATPLSKNGYKVKTAHTALKRAILVAATGKWS
jgi:xanthine dehydrogenase YagS FAD-binding subunit